MKKIILIALSVIVLISCNSSSYKVVGEIKGLPEGTKVFLEKQDKVAPSGIKTVDTVKIEKGKFVFEGSATEPELHFIQVESVNGKVPFILENGSISVLINKDSINNTKLSGSFNNDELNKYNKNMMKIQKSMMDFQQKNMATMQAASQKNDTVTMNKLRKEYNVFTDNFKKESETYIQKNPKSYISVLLLNTMFGEMEPKLDKIKKYYDALDPEVKETKVGKEIKTSLDKIKAVEVGQKAPEFSAKNPDGKMVSLKESLGKVTIVDFWASWCAPCRQENPNVVALYNEFHAKGLNIIGVSLDRAGEGAKWEEAIAKDQLTWSHVSNLKFWEEPIAISYGVKSIPAMFILDASGKIVAKDLRGAELKAKIAELLAK
jgi:peroxiredoxin